MKKLLLLTTISIVTFSACKKDDDNDGGGGDDTPPEATYEIAQVKTDFGDIYIWLYDETPLHKANYIKQAKLDSFDGTTFHRLAPNFVIQGGDPNSKDSDPNNDGSGGPGYTVEAEIGQPHIYGAVGAARNNNPEKRSNGMQFYIVVDKNGEPGLDGNYTVFGEVIGGMDVAETISKEPNIGSPSNRAVNKIPMDVNIITKTAAELKAEFSFELPQ